MLRITEFMPNTKFLVDHSQVVCHDNAMTQDVCSNILFLVAGYNSEQLNKVNPAGAGAGAGVPAVLRVFHKCLWLRFAFATCGTWPVQAAQLPSCPAARLPGCL